MKNFIRLLLSSAALLPLAVHATVRLPRFVADHMVLQRDAPVPLWGWATAGETVTVTFRQRTYKATPDAGTGRWQVSLPAQPAGGPYELIIKGQNTIQLRDVLFGDVWLASGQSNMEWPLRDAQNGAQEVAAADFPQIRLLNVDNVPAFSPQADISSAAGWLFGRGVLLWPRFIPAIPRAYWPDWQRVGRHASRNLV